MALTTTGIISWIVGPLIVIIWLLNLNIFKQRRALSTFYLALILTFALLFIHSMKKPSSSALGSCSTKCTAYVTQCNQYSKKIYYAYCVPTSYPTLSPDSSPDYASCGKEKTYYFQHDWIDGVDYSRYLNTDVADPTTAVKTYLYIDKTKPWQASIVKQSITLAAYNQKMLGQRISFGILMCVFILLLLKIWFYDYHYSDGLKDYSKKQIKQMLQPKQQSQQQSQSRGIIPFQLGQAMV